MACTTKYPVNDDDYRGFLLHEQSVSLSNVCLFVGIIHIGPHTIRCIFYSYGSEFISPHFPSLGDVMTLLGMHQNRFLIRPVRSAKCY